MVTPIQRTGAGRILAARRSDIPFRAKPHVAAPYAGDAPAAFNLLGACAPVRDQGQTSICVGEAFARTIHIANGGQGAFPSELAICTGARTNERARKGVPIKDDGCRLVDALAWVQDWGIVSEAAWPLDASKVNDDLPEDVLGDEVPIDPDAVSQIATLGDERVQAVKASLLAKTALVFAQDVDQAFEDMTAGQVYGGLTGPSLGGHAMTIVGYDDAVNAFLVCNSWGPGWCSGGFCLLGYAWVATPGVEGLIGISHAPLL